MVSYAKPSVVMWCTSILVLAIDIGITFIPCFIHHPLIQNYIKPLTTAIFLMEALLFDYPSYNFGSSKYGSVQTSAMITILFIVVFLILDIFLPNNSSGGEGENQDNQENATPGDGKKPNVDDVKSMDYMVALNFIIIWCAYMMEGMVTPYQWKILNKYWDEGWHHSTTVNFIFRQIFRMATLQYVYGMYAMASGVPFWLYLVLMLPQAILYPLAFIISYYVDQRDRTSMDECNSVFKCLLSGSLLYMGFRMLFEFQGFFKNEPDMKNKLIQGGVLALGYLWMIFVAGIDIM